MDYLFYGHITTFKRSNTTTISLSITCDPDETLELYELSPKDGQQLAYSSLPIERYKDHVSSQFEVQNDHIFLFIIAGKSNDGPFPFEVTYAVYNDEVISLPENNVVYLQGTTYLFHSEDRKVQM